MALDTIGPRDNKGKDSSFGALIILKTLFVEFCNNITAVELILGAGRQFKGGVNLISAFADVGENSNESDAPAKITNNVLLLGSSHLNKLTNFL